MRCGLSRGGSLDASTPRRQERNYSTDRKRDRVVISSVRDVGA
jgi:hypothetical protein